MYLRWIGLTIGLTALFTTGGLWLDQLRQDLPPAQAFAEVKNPETQTQVGPSQIIQVQSPYVISGAVNKPGKYLLAAGSTLAQLVSRAGGLKAQAKIEAKALLRPLNPGEIVFIESRKTTTAKTTQTQSAEATQDKVHINQASAQELQKLKGVGPALAKRIIQYRQSQGLFQSLNALTQVKGIGPKRLEKWKAQLSL